MYKKKGLQDSILRAISSSGGGGSIGGRHLHELDHRGGVTTQQPSSMSASMLRSSAENLPNLSQHQHPPHPHALNIGVPSHHSHVRLYEVFIAFLYILYIILYILGYGVCCGVIRARGRYVLARSSVGVQRWLPARIFYM